MLSALLPFFAQAATLSFADDSEVRLRRYRQESRWDATTVPSATLEVTTKRSQYQLQYSPSFTALALGEPEYELVVYHEASASSGFRWRHHSLVLNQTFAYGERNFRLEAAPSLDTPDSPDEPAPAVPEPDTPQQPELGQVGAIDQVVRYGASSTTAGASHALSRRVVVQEFVQYGLSRGLGSGSSEIYPAQSEVAGGVGVSYAPSARDRFETGASARRVWTDPDIRVTLADLTETWSRSLTRRMELSIGAGAAYGLTETDTGATETFAFGPTSEVSVVYTWARSGSRYDLTARAGVTPSVDRFTGLVDTRATWGLEFSRQRDTLTLSAATTGAHSLEQDSPNALSIYGGSLGAELGVTPEFDLRAGTAVSVQVVGDAKVNPLWVGFVGFTYRPLAIRL